MRYFIRFSYKGTSFHGWQVQHNAPSVQEALEQTLSMYLGRTVAVTGCGRTDTGVHALDSVAHFDVNRPLENTAIAKYKINAILGPDVAVSDIFSVPDDAHARFSCLRREYRYFIHFQKDPFLQETSRYYPYPVDITAMNAAAALLVGTRDFTSFAKLHSQTKNNICTVSKARWIPLADPHSLHASQTHRICFCITADRFLRNMVRSIVGTLLEIGRGRQDTEWILQVLSQKDRCAAGTSVPAHGLYLWKVHYDPAICPPACRTDLPL